MSTLGGPKVVTSGLVYAVDAADLLSFKGEPTTNRASSPHTLTSNYAATATPANGTNLNFTGEYNAGTVTGSGWFARTGSGGSGGIGVRYTTSWYLKAGSLSSVQLGWGGVHGGNVTNFTVNLLNGAVSSVSVASGESYGVDAMSNGYWRAWYSSTLSSSTNYYPQINVGSGFIIVGGIQIEEKPYPTRFVDGTRGSTLYDLAGNARDGTLVNGPRESSERAGCISFDGTDDYISLPSIVLGNTFTLSSFVRINTTAVEGCIYGSDSNGQDNWFSIYGDKVYLYATQSADVNNRAIIGTTPMSTSSWYHAAATVNTNTMKVYLNGVEEATLTEAFNFGGWNSTGAIGRRGGLAQRYFNGSIANLQMYNRVLSVAEIRSIYSSLRGRFGA